MEKLRKLSIIFLGVYLFWNLLMLILLIGRIITESVFLANISEILLNLDWNHRFVGYFFFFAAWFSFFDYRKNKEKKNSFLYKTILFISSFFYIFNISGGNFSIFNNLRLIIVYILIGLLLYFLVKYLISAKKILFFSNLIVLVSAILFLVEGAIAYIYYNGNFWFTKFSGLSRPYPRVLKYFSTPSLNDFFMTLEPIIRFLDKIFPVVFSISLLFLLFAKIYVKESKFTKTKSLFIFGGLFSLFVASSLLVLIYRF